MEASINNFKGGSTYLGERCCNREIIALSGMSCGLKNEEMQSICDEDGAHYYYSIMYTRFKIYMYKCTHTCIIFWMVVQANELHVHVCMQCR